MQCDRARDLIGAYRDGELPAEEREAVARHVAACADCAAMLADFERIGAALVSHHLAHPPDGLRAAIHAALDASDRARLVDRATGDAALVPLPAAGDRLTRLRDGIRRIASFTAVAVVAAGLGWWVAASRIDADLIEREVLAAHIRSLLQEQPVAIASSDQHQIRPWFAGRADFAPAVRDLATDGFALVGGRLDYVDGTRVGVVVYRRRLHVINVFMWPAATAVESAPAVVARKGYTLVTFTRGGVVHWLASDLNAEELRQLARLL